MNESTIVITFLVAACAALLLFGLRLRDQLLRQRISMSDQRAIHAENMSGLERQILQKDRELARMEADHRQQIVRFEREIAERDQQLVAIEAAQAQAIADLEAQIVEKDREFAENNLTHTKIISQLEKQLLEKEREFAQTDAEKTRKVIELEKHIESFTKDTLYKQALMLTLSNSAYDALLVVDEACKVIASNTSAEQLFEQNDLLGKDLVEITGAPELRVMVEDALINAEESYEEQIIIEKRNYRVHTQVIRRQGNLFIGLAIRDITQLVRLNRARRDMVANISHELRTPIANIRLVIDGLFHDQDKPKRKDSITSLRTIARETDNLLWLVQEMSDLSMIESGQAIVRLVAVPLTELIDESIDRMVDQSERYSIKIVRHVPEKLMVLCDRDLAQRVLVNLMHNALKWSPKDDAVTISASNDGEEITITVIDNGPGVPEDKVDRIFERFYQVDASRSRSRGEGTGLGLAICRHIVEAHGGRIWAESNRGGAGGRFKFTLLSAGERSEEEEETVEQPS